MQQQQQQEGEFRRNMGLALLLAKWISSPLEAWCRKFGTWGECYAGMNMVIGVILLLVVPVLAAGPKADPAPIVLTWHLTIAALIAHRVVGIKLRRDGYLCHSRYSGASRFGDDDRKAKTITEPCVFAVIGALLMAVSPPLGGYVLVAAICLGLSAAWVEEQENTRQRQVRDAWLMSQAHQRRW